MYRVVLADPPSPYVSARLADQVDLHVVAPDRSDLGRLLATADALFVRLYPVTAALLAQAPRLKVIGRHGVGYDSIDVAAATARGVPVVYAPNANSDSVAEHCVMLMLALARRLVYADRGVRAGDWIQQRDWSQPGSVGMELRETTVGIIGMGQVGRRVAQICGVAFGMTVLGYDPVLSPAAFPTGVIRVEALTELLSRADIVTLHAPLTPATRHLIDAGRLAQMKPGALLINTARGGLVDEAALQAALTSGHLAGAGLDVLEEEPPRADHPLLTWDPRRVTLTPHVAGISERSLQRVAELVCGGVLAVLRGERPPNVVNPEVWSRS